MPSFSAYISPLWKSRRTKHSYAFLLNDEPDVDDPPRPNTEKDQCPTVGNPATGEYRSLLRQLFLILGLCILFTIVSTTIIVTTSNNTCPNSYSAAEAMPATVSAPFTKTPPEMSNLTPKDCGNNSSTARERGCHFDIMSMIWIPHECYDPDLTGEFAATRQWEWSLHENGTDPIPESEIIKGDIQHGWVQFEYHLTHCLYTWKKLIRQVERGGGPIDGYISNSSHTHHCSRMLQARKTPLETWNTPFIVLYPTCYV